MLNFIKLRRRPRHFARLVGLNIEQFDHLLHTLRPVYEQALERTRNRPQRLRAAGGGRLFALSLDDRLLATLLFYRLHVTGLLLSYLFDLDESNLWRERHQRMVPVLLEVLPVPMQDHLLSCLETPSDKAGAGAGAGAGSPGRKRIGTLEELMRLHPELREICVDATEQQVPKAQDKRRNRQSYSGKSHAHTTKTQITSSQRLILHVFGNCPGNLADRSLLKASGVIPALSRCASPSKRKERLGKRPVKLRPRRVRLDRGYSGIEKQYRSTPYLEVRAALKGTSKSKVTLLGKLWNRLMVSKARIQIEQDIAHLKNWRVLSGLYRAQVHTHAQTVSLVAGLHNFQRLGRLHW